MEDDSIERGCPTSPKTACADSAATPATPASRAKALRALALALPLAFLWTVAVDGLGISLALILVGGVAVTLGILGFLGAEVLLGRGGERDWARLGPSLAAAAALACVPAVTMDQGVRVANAFVLGLACMRAHLLLGGCDPEVAEGLRGLLRSVGYFVTSQLRRIGDVVRAALPTTGHARSLVPAALSLLASAAVLGVVMPLLMEADALFAAGVGRALGALSDDLMANVARALRLCALTLVSGSMLLSGSLGDSGRMTARPRPALAAPAAARLPLLVVLDLVYLAFVALQFSYLFGGPGALAVAGGHAEYARSGFFQLVWVAAINLGVVAMTRWVGKGSPRSLPVVIAQLVLLALTIAIDGSAALRMTLYVGRYGMSELRAFTYLGMVAIAAAVVLVAAATLVPTLRPFRAVFVCMVVLWVGFALSGVDARVADYNVDRYLEGSLQEIDVSYLGSLSPDAIPALERLATEATDPTVIENAWMELQFLQGRLEVTTWPEASLPSLLAPRRATR